jgi:hypothetical protein
VHIDAIADNCVAPIGQEQVTASVWRKVEKKTAIVLKQIRISTNNCWVMCVIFVHIHHLE